MQAIILAAGKGTRMLPLTEQIPKPLVQLSGRPILEHILESLPEKIDEIIIVHKYKGEQIQRYFGSSFLGKKITYKEQGSVKGTYGALFSVKDILRSEFLVLGADDIVSKEDLEILTAGGLSFGIHSKILPGKNSFIIDIKSGYVKGMRKGYPEEMLLPQPMCTGMYVLDTSFWELTPIGFGEGVDKEYGIPQTLMQDFSSGLYRAVSIPSWVQINSIEELLSAEKILINKV